MSFELTILGSGSAVPVIKRNPTAHVLNVRERFFLIDCGEGTQMQMQRFGVKGGKINHIFISHLHGDHCLGLMGLLSTMHLLGRQKELHIYSPPGLKQMIDLQLKTSGSTLSYKIFFNEMETGQPGIAFDADFVEVSTFPLKHRIACNGYLFREKALPRNMIKEKIVEYQLSIEQIQKAKSGEDIFMEDGKKISNEEITRPPPKPRSYAFCSDTIYDEQLVEYINGVDLLYHETTFLEDRAEQARLRFHSTAKEAATIARKANVKQLVIGHFSSRYDELSGFLEEAQTIFENTILAEDGLKIKIDN